MVDFAVQADHRVKIKENKKRDKYLNLAREPKKIWNIKVMVIQIIISVLEMITKSLVRECWKRWKLEDKLRRSKP